MPRDRLTLTWNSRRPEVVEICFFLCLRCEGMSSAVFILIVTIGNYGAPQRPMHNMY